ncbi:MAG TPA: TolC family protein [Burkholderiales bacterium]|nr:TolC family protein [Burkholderiales bacterium]
MKSSALTHALLWLFVALLAGCASYHDRPLDLSGTAQTYQSRTLDNPQLEQYIDVHSGQKSMTWPLRTWDLNHLTLAAYYYSPDLDVARTKWGSAAASVTAAGQKPNPVLSLPFQYTPASPWTIGQSPWTFGLGLDIPIETAGKRGYRVAQARQLSNAAVFDIGNVAWQVGSRVRAQLLALFFLARQESVLAQITDTQERIVAILNKRTDAGEASAPDANIAVITLMRNRADLAKVRKQLTDARLQLAAVIGIPPNALRGVEFGFDAFKHGYPEIDIATAHRLAVLNRADILAALARYQASQAALQLEIANQYPDIHLDPGYAWVESEKQISFGVSGITLPVFNRHQGQIAQAEALRAEAESRVKRLQAQAFSETDSALADYRAAVKILKQADAGVAAQSAQLVSAQHAFAAGTADRLALSLAQQAFDISRLSREQVLMQVQQAIGALQDAIQRPLPFAGLNAFSSKGPPRP